MRQPVGLPRQAGSRGSVTVKAASSGIVGLSSSAVATSPAVNMELARRFEAMNDPVWRRVWCCGNLFWVGILIVLTFLFGLFCLTVAAIAFFTEPGLNIVTSRSSIPMARIGAPLAFEDARVFYGGTNSVAEDSSPLTYPGDARFGAAIDVVRTANDTLIAVGAPGAGRVSVIARAPETLGGTDFNGEDFFHLAEIEDPAGGKGSFGDDVAIGDDVLAVLDTAAGCVHAFVPASDKFVKAATIKIPSAIAPLSASVSIELAATHVVRITVVHNASATTPSSSATFVYHVTVPTSEDIRAVWSWRAAGKYVPISAFTERGVKTITLSSAHEAFTAPAAGHYVHASSPAAIWSASQPGYVSGRSSDFSVGSAMLAAAPLTSDNVPGFRLLFSDLDAEKPSEVPNTPLSCDFRLTSGAGSLKFINADGTDYNFADLKSGKFHPISVRPLWMPTAGYYDTDSLRCDYTGQPLECPVNGRALPSRTALSLHGIDIRRAAYADDSVYPADGKFDMKENLEQAEVFFGPGTGTEYTGARQENAVANAYEVNLNVAWRYDAPAAHTARTAAQATYAGDASSGAVVRGDSMFFQDSYDAVTLEAHQEVNAGAYPNTDGLICPVTTVLVFFKPTGLKHTCESASIRVLRTCAVEPRVASVAGFPLEGENGLSGETIDFELGLGDDNSAATVIRSWAMAPDDDARAGCSPNHPRDDDVDSRNAPPALEFVQDDPDCVAACPGVYRPVPGGDARCRASANVQLVETTLDSLTFRVTQGVAVDEYTDFDAEVGGLRRRYTLTRSHFANVDLKHSTPVAVGAGLIIVGSPDADAGKIVIRSIAGSEPDLELDRTPANLDDIYKSLNVHISPLGKQAPVDSATYDVTYRLPTSSTGSVLELSYANSYIASIAAGGEADSRDGPLQASTYSCMYVDDLARPVMRLAVDPYFIHNATDWFANTGTSTDKTILLPNDFFAKRITGTQLFCDGANMDKDLTQTYLPWLSIRPPNEVIRLHRPDAAAGFPTQVLTDASSPADKATFDAQMDAYMRPTLTDTGRYVDLVFDPLGTSIAPAPLELLSSPERQCEVHVLYEDPDGGHRTTIVNMEALFATTRMDDSRLVDLNYGVPVSFNAMDRMRDYLCRTDCTFNVGGGAGTCGSTLRGSGGAEITMPRRGELFSLPATSDVPFASVSPKTHDSESSQPLPTFYNRTLDEAVIDIAYGSSNTHRLTRLTMINRFNVYDDTRVSTSPAGVYYAIQTTSNFESTGLSEKAIKRVLSSWPAMREPPATSFAKSFAIDPAWHFSTCANEFKDASADNRAISPYWVDTRRVGFIHPSKTTERYQLAGLPFTQSVFVEDVFETGVVPNYVRIHEKFSCSSAMITLYMGYLVFSCVGVVVLILIVVALMAPCIKRRYEDSVRMTKSQEQRMARKQNAARQKLHSHDRKAKEAAKNAQMQEMQRSMEQLETAGNDDDTILQHLTFTFGAKAVEQFKDYRRVQNNAVELV